MIAGNTVGIVAGRKACAKDAVSLMTSKESNSVGASNAWRRRLILLLSEQLFDSMFNGVVEHAAATERNAGQGKTSMRVPLLSRANERKRVRRTAPSAMALFINSKPCGHCLCTFDAAGLQVCSFSIERVRIPPGNSSGFVHPPRWVAAFDSIRLRSDQLAPPWHPATSRLSPFSRLQKSAPFSLLHPRCSPFPAPSPTTTVGMFVRVRQIQLSLGRRSLATFTHVAKPRTSIITSSEGPQTMYDKIWDDHIVDGTSDGAALLYIDRHLVHEVTSPQAFEGMEQAGRPVRRPDCTLVTVDVSDSHSQTPRRHRLRVSHMPVRALDSSYVCAA